MSFKPLIMATALVATAATALAQEAPADVVTPIDAPYLEVSLSAAEAKADSGYVYSRPTPDNTIFLFVDQQIGLMSGVRDFESLAAYKANVVALAKSAKALGAPVLLTTSNAQWQNGDILPELRQIFPDEPIYRRTGIINAYSDPVFRQALLDLMEETGRDHIVISGVTVSTCVTFPVLSMLNDGIEHVFPVIDASGAWSNYEAQAAMLRMSEAGAQVTTTFSLAAEIQADWRTESANAMLDPFSNELPEYGWVVQNFWNNVGARKVADPYGLVE